MRLSSLHPGLRLRELRNALTSAIDAVGVHGNDWPIQHTFVRTNELIVAVTSLQACLILEHPRPHELVADELQELREPRAPGTPGRPRKEDEQEEQPARRMSPYKRLLKLRHDVLTPLDFLIDLQNAAFVTPDEEEDAEFAIQQAYTYCSDIAQSVVNLQAYLISKNRGLRQSVSGE